MLVLKTVIYDVRPGQTRPGDQHAPTPQQSHFHSEYTKPQPFLFLFLLSTTEAVYSSNLYLWWLRKRFIVEKRSENPEHLMGYRAFRGDAVTPRCRLFNCLPKDIIFIAIIIDFKDSDTPGCVYFKVNKR